MISKNLHAADILDAWAAAIRSDWSTIDGRSCRRQLEEISNYLRGESDSLHHSDVGVCMVGGPHWFGEGWQHECGNHYE